jgi:hypothetical protein
MIKLLSANITEERVVNMNKTDKKAITSSSTNLKVNPPTVKVLPFDNGSKKKITRKQE